MKQNNSLYLGCQMPYQRGKSWSKDQNGAFEMGPNSAKIFTGKVSLKFESCSKIIIYEFFSGKLAKQNQIERKFS